jgi:hypothetical protein
VAKIGNGGAAALASLLEYNLLALRPDSELARDLAQEVFGAKVGQNVVAMPSAARLYHVLQMDAMGELGD